MRNRFLKKNNRKKIAISVCSLALVAIVSVFCIYHSKILAGVFQAHKDNNGNVTYTAKNTIHVLEIVAQNGQQILGYTVKGSEPITVEQIESYTGTISDLEDFKNATGYEVEGTAGHYKVKSSGNEAFGENVLSGQMFENDDKIIVDVVEAKDFTKENLDGIDLVYINSADYNPNLLYYYDQIVNGGADGIQPGEYGRTYADSYVSDVKVKEIAVETILRAVGRPAYAEALTEDLFEKAEVQNYKDYNFANYKSEIGAATIGSLTGANTDESVSKIDDFLLGVNNSFKSSAASSIKPLAKKGSIDNLTDEEKENFALYIKQGEFAGYSEINIDSYMLKIIESSAASTKRIETAIRVSNKNNKKDAEEELLSIKNGTYVNEESIEDYRNRVGKDIGMFLHDIYTTDFDQEKCIAANLSAYVDEFLKDETVLGDSSVFRDNLIGLVIKPVNESEREKAFELIASAAANSTVVEQILADKQAADISFKRTGMESYKSYNLESYLHAFEALTDENALKSLQQSEDGSYVYKYDVTKIESVIKEVNDTAQGIDTSCDLNWNAALALYDYATTDGAFVYNTDLLTSGKLGNYTAVEGGSNNVYKMLLVLRQLRPTYFNQSVRPSIDTNGNYVDASGSAIGNWYGGTFCNGWNGTSVDYTKYREPSVVGKLYDESGNIIGDTVYINENIFSYSGGSYFGGGTFWNKDYTADTGIAPEGASQSNIKKKRLYISSTDVSDSNYWWYTQAGNGYQYIYYTYKDEDGTSKSEYIKMVDIYDTSSYMYYVDIPVTTTWFYVCINQPTWKEFNRTVTYKNATALADGAKLYIKNQGYSNKNVSSPIDGRKNLKEKLFKLDLGTGTNPPCDTNIDDTSTGNYTKGEALRKIMNISLNQLQSMPFKVLEVQPTGNVNDFASYAGAVKLASYLRVDVPGMNSSNYKDYFQVEAISVAEFNTRHEELNGRYDLIYIGKNTGALYAKEYKNADGTKIKRTVFGDGANNDCTVVGEQYYMNGLVYYGFGPAKIVGALFRGTVASDYDYATSSNGSYYNDQKIWKQYFFAEFKRFQGNYNNGLSENMNYTLKSSDVSTRISGNDLTVARMNDLLDYLKAGYPVLFADGLLDCDDDTKYVDCYDKALTQNCSYNKAVKWRYVDKNSKMYAFIQQAKAIGRDSTGEYTVEKAAADGVKDAKAFVSLVSTQYASNGRNPDKLAAAEKFNGGLSYAVKRNEQVDFEVINEPQEYDKDADGNELPAGQTGNYVTDLSSCMFTLKPGINRDNTMQWINDNYEFHMYIDKSGTANFPDDKTIELDLAEPYYNEKDGTIQVGMKNGKWPTGIEGLIAWKLEAVSKNNPGNRWEHVGYSAFKQSQVKDVYVLWVKTNNTTLDFDNMVARYDGKLNGSTDVIPEYNIIVDTIKYDQFVKNWNNQNVDQYTKANSLLKVGKLNNYEKRRSNNQSNGTEYNMIVFGYCDSYAGLDINNINCLKNIDYFVHTAKNSLLFAHDNASYITTFNYYLSNGKVVNDLRKDTTNFARYTTSYMRGMLGMDVYGASYSALAFDKNLEESNPDAKNGLLSWLYTYDQSLVNARSYLGIDNIANPTQEEQSALRGITNGQLFRYSTQSDYDFPYRNNEGTGSALGKKGFDGSWITTKHIEATNKGQINIYPFNIGDEIDLSAVTHFQYTRLNLEDDDTTVWYTLSGANGNSQLYNVEKGDGSNNFYIYSKGNITYTGAGHQKISEDSLETKLFVNTVIAAIKVGDFAPDVIFPDATTVNGKDVIYGYDTEDKLTVTYKATDYGYVAGEKDRFTDIRIFLDKKKTVDGSVVNDGSYNASDDILLNQAGTPGYLKDVDGNVMSITAADVINRENKTFYLSNSDLKALCIQYVYNGNDPYAGQQGITDGRYVKDLFDKYSICVSVLSRAEEERYNTELVDNPSENKENYYQSACADVVLRNLFNLD